MSYSIDLRGRVVGFVEAGNTKTSALKLFRISRDTLYRWLKQKAQTGTLADAPKSKTRRRKIDTTALIAAVEKEPDRTLKEYGAAFGVRDTSILRAFRRLKITRKKRRSNTKNGMTKNEPYLRSS